MRRLLPPALLAVTLLTGCERPLIDPETATVTETTPDLDVVLTEPVLPLQVRVSDGDGVSRVTINGVPASPTAEADTYLDTLTLRFGLNAITVAIYDADENVVADTLYALHLPYAAALAPSLPETRYDHTATRLPDGRILVAGGYVGGDPVFASQTALLVEEAGGAVAYNDAPDAPTHGRAGHSATLLPDGRVLVLGGVKHFVPDETDFVSQPEVYDPATGAFTAVPLVGEPFRRYEHATVALAAEDGRQYVYAYGGLEWAAGSVAATGSLVAFELRVEEGVESLVTLSPPGGLGALPPTFAHALLPLPAVGDARRALAVGGLAGGNLGTPLAYRLRFRPSSTFFPFEVTDERTGAPDEALGQAGGATIEPGLLFFSGGGPLNTLNTPGAPASPGLRVYADGADRFFAFPAENGLLVPRARHTATLLPSGRILALGGVGPDLQPLAQAEFIGPN